MRYRLETEIGDVGRIYEVPSTTGDDVIKVRGVELAEKIVCILNATHDVEEWSKRMPKYDAADLQAHFEKNPHLQMFQGRRSVDR